MADFDNPAFEPEKDDLDQTFLDDPEEPLLPRGDELPTVPNEPADATRNEQAKKDFYKFVQDKGWDQEPGDIDKNALIEHGATIHKDRYTGKVYVRYRGKDVILTKKKREVVLQHQTQSGKMLWSKGSMETSLLEMFLD